MIELHFEVYSPTLIYHPLFEQLCKLHPPLIRKICHLALSELNVSFGDVIFTTGEHPMVSRAFFVMSGRVGYRGEVEGEEYHQVLDGGDCVAEPALWTTRIHHGTLRASTDSRLVALGAKEFQEVVLSFPTDWEALNRYAEAFVTLLNDTGADDVDDLGGFLWDNIEDVMAFAFAPPEAESSAHADALPPVREGVEEHVSEAPARVARQA